MKTFLTALVLVLFFISCKKGAPPEKTSGYPAFAVGVEKADAVYPEVVNQDVLKQEWQKQLRAAGITSEIESFKIGQLRVAGDGNTVGSVVYTGLTAITADGKSSICARLDLKQGKYYFNADTPAIICHGTCPNGCNPSGVLKNGNFFLVCSECADCVKTDFFLNLP